MSNNNTQHREKRNITSNRLSHIQIISQSLYCCWWYFCCLIGFFDMAQKYIYFYSINCVAGVGWWCADSFRTKKIRLTETKEESIFFSFFFQHFADSIKQSNVDNECCYFLFSICLFGCVFCHIQVALFNTLLCNHRKILRIHNGINETKFPVECQLKHKKRRIEFERIFFSDLYLVCAKILIFIGNCSKFGIGLGKKYPNWTNSFI